jgi:hypothetical protein
MLGFIRHKAQSLISNKKSATFDGSTYWRLIPSIEGIPSQVAPQQSLCPFIPTCKCIKNSADTVYFTLPMLVCNRYMFACNRHMFARNRSQLHYTQIKPGWQGFFYTRLYLIQRFVSEKFTPILNSQYVFSPFYSAR